MAIIEFFKIMLMTIGAWFEVIFKVLGIYRVFDDIKEMLIAELLGMPVWVISLVSLIVTITSLIIKFQNKSLK